MSNPVLSKPQAFQPAADQYSYDPYSQQGYGQFAPQSTQPQGVMTIEDVITKSAITMGSLFLVAAVVFMGFLGGIIPLKLLVPVTVISALVAFVTVLIVSTRRVVKPAFVLVYTAIEGVLIGGFSALFEILYPGIVAQAVLGTFVAAGVVLAAYKTLRIRVTNKFRKIVTLSTGALAAVMLFNLGLSFFMPTGMRAIGSGAGMLAIIVSVIAVVLAVANLIMDFDYIEQGIAMRAPASESWRAALGLTVTMVWLYTEILRILSYFRD